MQSVEGLQMTYLLISSKSIIPEGNKDPKFFTPKLRVFVIWGRWRKFQRDRITIKDVKGNSRNTCSFFFFIIVINWVYISYFSASCSVIALSCAGYILAKWTWSLLMTQFAFYIEISLIHHWDSFSLYMNCFFLKHRWDYGTDNHPEQSSLKML